jgi:hypothetical protein
MEKYKDFAFIMLAILIGSALRIIEDIKNNKLAHRLSDWLYEIILTISLMFITILIIGYIGIEDQRLSGGIGFVAGYAGIAIVNITKEILIKLIKNKHQ